MPTRRRWCSGYSLYVVCEQERGQIGTEIEVLEGEAVMFINERIFSGIRSGSITNEVGHVHEEPNQVWLEI